MLFKYGYNAKEHINSLQEDFRKEDSFRKDFVSSFKFAVHTQLKANNTLTTLPIHLQSLTENYALMVISSVRSSLDKNIASPSYRIEEEIDALKSINHRYTNLLKSELSKKVLSEVESLILNKFPEITEQSELSRRLLTVNLEWHHISYIAEFKP